MEFLWENFKSYFEMNLLESWEDDGRDGALGSKEGVWGYSDDKRELLTGASWNFSVKFQRFS